MLIAVAIISSMHIYFTCGTGGLIVLVADPPAWGEATDVYIKCSKIEINKASQEDSRWITVTEDAGWINLTDILDTSKVLGEVDLQAGKYGMIQFEILEAKVTVNEVNQSAIVPSGKLWVAITHGGVTVNAGQTSKVLIDFETQVIHALGRGYVLRPTVKAIPLGDR